MFWNCCGQLHFLLQIIKSPLDQRLHFCFTFTRCIIKQIIIIIRGVELLISCQFDGARRGTNKRKD